MRVPTSTYRLQMSGLGFARARELVRYLHRLGVGDVYCSPLLRAAPGSTHGYDVADPTMLDPSLGSMDEFEAFSAELRAHGMGMVLDIVPNHMVAAPSNPWWRDVLAAGRRSRWAGAFDIDWEANGGRLLLPVLGAPLEQVLASGELTVQEGELVYYDRRFPLREGSPAGDVRAVVEAQHYELAHWQEQATRLNYRRFFDITELVGVRVEEAWVFDAVHELVLELVRRGHVTGLRIDHIDGLLDPRAYLERLQQAARDASGRDEQFYVVVEKILAADEQLPRSWPVAGTTGYEFLDVCDGLFVDADGAERLAGRYSDITGVHEPFPDIVRRAKLRIVREYFWGELGRLASRIVPTRDEEDAEFRRVRDALAVVTAELPVYRTYVDRSGRSSEDEHLIEASLAAAAADDGVDAAALATVAAALRDDVDFCMRWQQFSGPVTAKSVEDTAFYRYYALPPRNEVGAHPTSPAAAAGTFHWFAGRMHEQWPHSLTASSTHDTKRSEDVRARMMAVTARPDDWADTVERWLDEFDAPDRNDGWMVASTLVGAWPIEFERLREYVLKAVREEKLRTSWTDPDTTYETAITGFAERLCASGVADDVARRLAPAGARNALAAAALKLFAPGVPDTYQGSEAGTLSLVDPDNRRPVDFDGLAQLVDSPGAPDKLRLISACLRVRRANAELFAQGEYLPLRAPAPGALGFARRLGDAWAIAAVPLPDFQAGSTGAVDPPADAPAKWHHVVTGEPEQLATPLSRMFERFPVAVLIGGSARAG